MDEPVPVNAEPVEPPANYPEVLECDVTTLLKTTVHVRPIRPDDGPALAQFHRGLSSQSVYFRFFSPHPELSQAEIHRFTNVDYADRMALIVEVYGALVAVGRYDRLPGTSEAEVAFVVADEWQHHGIATMLLDLLANAAWLCGIDVFVATTMLDNHDMLHVFAHSRFDVTTRLDGGMVAVRFPIGPGSHHRDAEAGGPGPAGTPPGSAGC